MNAIKGMAAVGMLTSLGLLVGAGITRGQNAPATAQATTADLFKLPPLTKDAGDGDYMIAPPYANAPELTPRDDVPKGMVYRFTMQSTDSKIYPGISKTAPGQVVPYQRRVTVYVPSQYVPGTPAPFFVSQDSMGQGHIPTILDNMIADHRLPVMVAVMIDSGGGDAQGSERGLEYDTVSGRYAEFIETEVLPKITQEYKVTFSKNPDARMTMGGSSGGAAAFSMAWYHPEWYHRVLTYSGTYVNQQSPLNPDSPRGAWEYHAHFIPESKRKPLRIWMQVGENDIRSHDPEATYHNWVMANQRMAEVLKAKKIPLSIRVLRGCGACGRQSGESDAAAGAGIRLEGLPDQGNEGREDRIRFQAHLIRNCAHPMDEPTNLPAESLTSLVEQVRRLVQRGRRTAAASINAVQVVTNFEIGRLIVKHEQQGALRRIRQADRRGIGRTPDG